MICNQEIFSATPQLGYNEVAVQANLQVMPELKCGFLVMPLRQMIESAILDRGGTIDCAAHKYWG